MGVNATRISATNLAQIRNVHRDLLEKALHMRCLSYLADAKASLLVQTVASVGQSKRVVSKDLGALRSNLTSLNNEMETRKRLELRLQQLSDALDRSSILVLIRRSGRTVYTNDAFRETFGEAEGDDHGSLYEMLAAGERSPAGIAELAGRPWASEQRLRCRDDVDRWFRVTISHGGLPYEAGYDVVIFEDVSLAQEAQLRTATAQRLEALGQLVGGVAHDVNNLLTIVSNSTALLRIVPEERDTVLDQIDKAVQQGGKLTRQLLAFARRQVLTPESVNVQDTAAGCVELMRRTATQEHQLVLEDLAPRTSARCDVAQLEAAIINMIINARDASPRGASIEVSIALCEVESDRACGPGVLRPGSFVRIAVRDHGHGIPTELRDRVWEPFVSTKDKGEHSGLGLSMVFGFAQQSGGGVELVTPPDGVGAEVVIYLPQSGSEG